MALGNETIHMLRYMSAEVVEPFMVNEIVDRLAAMLDYNLSQLVGPKCIDLKVKNPQKYHFQPRELLSEFIDIYLNLKTPTFVQAVARDERSYRKEYFSKAASVLLKYRIKSSDEIAALEQFVTQVEKAVQSGAEEEEELGEAPDEFLGKWWCRQEPAHLTFAYPRSDFLFFDGGSCFASYLWQHCRSEYHSGASFKRQSGSLQSCTLADGYGSTR